MTLFWTGMRLGELLALTPDDIDFEEKKISITKSYQRIERKDVITPPKTPKSSRVVTVPSFLLDEIQSYMDKLYGLESTDKLFGVTKYYMEHENPSYTSRYKISMYRTVICFQIIRSAV